MRHAKILLAALCVLGLSLATAEAGLNPADPGLAGGIATYNPNLSRICTDCHTGVPSAMAQNGTHFAYIVGSSALTRSGGGWTDGNWGTAPRTNGAYFKASKWSTQGTWSKFGNRTDNTSRFTAVASDNAGMGTSDTTLSNYAGYEIICESCHNMVHNVAGGNNLVAPMTGAYTANTGATTQLTTWSDGGEATLCVGCHGFMYTSNTANSADARYGDTRNNNEVAGSGLKLNNHRHTISGTLYANNHHVMTGDVFNTTMATAGLLWRDVLVVPADASGTFDSGSSRGQMPQRAPWINDGGKIKAAATTNFTCVHCHAAPHTGDVTTGASILRDTNAEGTNTGGAMARIGETGRTWMGFSDANYCNDCHRTK